MTNGDKRSVSTDALETLGKIIDDRAGRDAIHLAVEPVEAGERLQPGQHVGLNNGLAYGARGGARGHVVKALGIVDPFLSAHVEKGQKFWLVVYPRQISSLRHVWSHPDFAEEGATARVVRTAVAAKADEEILHNGAAAIGIGYSQFMEAVDEYVADRQRGMGENSICFGEDIEYGDLPTGFWDSYERVTGRKVPEEFRDVYFRCAC
jgi:hypothetical protein